MKITITGELIDLNTFINKNRVNKFAGASIKKRETEKVFLECRKQPLKKIKRYPVFLTFNWYMKNAKKDLDNVAFSKKFVLDGLVLAGVIENDSQRFVSGFKDLFFIDKTNPRIEIIIEEIK